MKLNIRTQTAQNQYNSSPIVLVHDLLGSFDNLDILARDLANDHNIIQIDIHNHDLSPRNPVVNYPVMAQDLVDTPGTLQVDKATFISYFMGGKVIMALTVLAPNRISELMTIDVTPVDYHVCRHNEIFAATNVVSESDAQARQQTATIIRQYLDEGGVVQFLLEFFIDGEWYFNVPVLWDQCPHIVGWEKTPAWNHPTLFIPGGSFLYVSEQYRDGLLAQFLQVRAHVIIGAGH